MVLMSQLTRLQTEFVNAEQADLDDYREKTNAYVAAVVKTTDALLSRDDVADDLKQKALEARFAALIRTAEFDPKRSTACSPRPTPSSRKKPRKAA